MNRLNKAEAELIKAQERYAKAMERTDRLIKKLQETLNNRGAK